MSKKSRLLTQVDFDRLLKSGNWEIEELDLNTIKLTPHLERKHHALGAFISGDSSVTARLNGLGANIGIDLLVHEPNPKRHKGEGDVNAYHYVITKTARANFPYEMHGPFYRETLIGHWPSDLNLGPYGR